MEWGDWVEHDGRAQPVPSGTYVQVEFDMDIPENHGTSWKVVNIRTVEGVVISPYNFSDRDEYAKVIRYRIRKPRGMTILEQIVMNPERELEEV